MSTQNDFDKLNILGVEIDAVSNSQAVKAICEHASAGRPAVYVVKPYVEFVDRAYRDKPTRELLNRAWLAVPDGVALVWAAAFLYAGPRRFWRFWLTLSQIVLSPGSLRWPLPDRAAGINFAWPMLKEAAARSLSVYLVGRHDQKEIDRTAAVLRRKLPEIKIAGARPGYDPASRPGSVSAHWIEATAADIEANKPDLILVGMGFPLQERICARLAGRLPHGVLVGEGGTFDYESFGGRRPKAPAAVQRAGLEWLWRLAQQPGRLRRQLAIPRFIWRVWNAH